MANYRPTKSADGDLAGIYKYSAETFGVAKAESYFATLKHCFVQLTENPTIGKAIDKVKAGYRRHICQSHLLIYRVNSKIIVIVRVLHQSMDLKRHL